MVVEELNLEELSNEIRRKIDDANKVDNKVAITLSLFAKENTPQDIYKCIRIASILESIVYHRINDVRRIATLDKYFGKTTMGKYYYHSIGCTILEPNDKQKEKEEK